VSRVTIIAEAGVNHNGEIEKAKQLIDAAAEAGADYVKFQTFKADKLVSTEAKKASYQAKNINDGDDSQYGMLKKLELSEEDHYILKKYADEAGIKFLSTGFDEDSLDFLDSVGIDFFKVPSGEITNYPYLKHMASKKKPVVVSTGMSSLGEIEQALDVLTEAGVSIENIAVLHCNSQYPTPFEDVNLSAMLSIRDAFKVRVGYSDHTLGIEIPIAAVALGATVIEKHFTLDRNLPGPDHKLALQGDGRKHASASELPNKNLVRKSIHLATDKKEGDVLSKSDLIMKRPGDGISPMLIDLVIGKKVSKNLASGEKLTWQHFH
jgi:N-acetylneuraminate synthase/N,N'-diacetyllegionaminate synthase